MQNIENHFSYYSAILLAFGKRQIMWFKKDLENNKESY